MMTQKERIANLEREVSDLRMLVQALQAAPRFVPLQPPYVWPHQPQRFPTVTYNDGTARPPQHLSAVAAS